MDELLNVLDVIMFELNLVDSYIENFIIVLKEKICFSDFISI